MEYTKGLGALAPVEVLSELRGVRRRHAAIRAVIAALEEARTAGCDLRRLWCRGCEFAPSRGRGKAA